MEHNQLDSQHSFTSEYQQEILESAANFSYVIINEKQLLNGQRLLSRKNDSIIKSFQ